MADKRTDKDDNVKKTAPGSLSRRRSCVSRYQEGRSSDISS